MTDYEWRSIVFEAVIAELEDADRFWSDVHKRIERESPGVLSERGENECEEVLEALADWQNSMNRPRHAPSHCVRKEL